MIKKKFFRLLMAAVLLFLAVNVSYATNYYWVGQGADNQWGTLRNWSSVSGGDPDTHGVIQPPTSMDDVFFDANSFTSTRKTVTISGNRDCKNISFNGCPSGTVFTLAAAAELHVYGSMTLQAGMITSGSGSGATIYFESTNAAETLNTNDVLIYPNLNFRGTAQWTNTGNLLLRETDGFGALTYNIPNKNLAINGNLTAYTVNFNGGGSLNVTGDIKCSTFTFAGGGDATATGNFSGTVNFNGGGDMSVHTHTSGNITFAGGGNYHANTITNGGVIDFNGGGNFTVDTKIVTCSSFTFQGNGNITVGYSGQTGEAMRVTNYSVSFSPYGTIRLYGTGIKKFYGDVVSTLAGSYSGITFNNGTVDIYGSFTVSGRHFDYYNSSYSGHIINGAKVTIYGDILKGTGTNTGGYFRVEGPATQLDVEGNFSMAYLDIASGTVNLKGALTGNYYSATYPLEVTITSGTFNNLGNKDINLLGGFSATGATAQVTGLDSIKVECDSWNYSGAALLPLNGVNAPKLIRVNRESFTARAADIYNDAEFYGGDANIHTINAGTFNKITVSMGGSNFSNTANITVDSLIISSRRFHTFNNTTNIDKLLQIRPQYCGGAINVRNGTINMGALAVVDVENVKLTNQTITGNPNYMAANSIDNGGNSGWDFTLTPKTYYWVGGTGNWDDSNHWASTSNGTPGSGCVPTIYDNVVFDEYSFTAVNQTVTLQSESYCHDMTWVNITRTPRISYGSTTLNELHISGSLQLWNGVGYNLYNTRFVSEDPNETIKTNGVVMNSNVYFSSKNSTTTFTLLDNFALPTSGTINLTAGCLNTDSKSVTAGYFLSTSGTRCLNIAGSVITINYGWNYTGAGGAALTVPLSQGSVIKILQAGYNGSNGNPNCHEFLAKTGDIYYNLEFTTGNVYLHLGSSTSTNRYNTKFIQNGIFNKITLYNTYLNYMNANADYGEHNFAANLRFEETDSLLLMGNLGVTYEVGANIKINKYFGNKQDCGLISHLRGASGAANLKQPQLKAPPYNTITMGAGAVVEINNIEIQTVNITGPAGTEMYSISNSIVLSGSGWDVAGGGKKTYYWVGGAGNWSDVTKWATTSGGNINPCQPPAYPDNVIFDDNSFTAINQRVTVNTNASCDSMTWTGTVLSSLTPELFLNGTGSEFGNTRRDLDIYGSLVLAAGMKVTGNTSRSNNFINLISKKPNETLKTNGVPINQIDFHFTGTTANWDIPDGFNGTGGTLANYTYRTSIYFDGTDAARYNVGGPIIIDYYTYYSGGTLDLTGQTLTTGFFSSTSGTRNLIIKNATINVFYNYSTTTNSWAYSGANSNLTAADSENSVINIRSGDASTMTTAANQVYNDVNFLNTTGTKSISSNNNAQFRDINFYGTGGGSITAGANSVVRDIVFYGTGTITSTAANSKFRNVLFNEAGTINSSATSNFNNVTFKKDGTSVTLGIYKKLRFEANALAIDRINADTLWFYNSTPATAYTYKFASNQTSTINKAWYASGTNCNPSKIESTVVGTRAKVSVAKAAANLADDPLDADTLYLDFMSIRDIEAVLGPDRALLEKGNQSTDLGNNLNWILDPYLGSAGFKGLGASRILTCNNIPFTISSVYFLPNPESTFEWRKGSHTGEIIGTGDKFLLNTTADAGTYYLDVFYYGVGSCMNSGMITLTVPDNDTLIWTGALNSNWNDVENWKTPANKVPMLPPDVCTNVHIPANLATYPDLSDSYTDYTQEDFEAASCKNIHFDYGGVVARTDSLRYKKAFVELKLSAFPWHTLSAPLRDMYSGDYAFYRATPAVQMRVFNSPSPETGEPAPVADWSSPFNTDTVRLTATMGYSARVGKVFYDENQFRPDPDDGLVSNPTPRIINDTIWRFPKNNTYFPYYDMFSLRWREDFDQNLPSADYRKHNSRFIYESNAPYSIEGGKQVLAVHKVPSGYAGLKVLVGNPFMSYLDFEEFYRINHNHILPQFEMIWEDNSVTFSATDTGNTGILTSPVGNRYISAMQSFIVTLRSAASSDINLKFIDDMSVLLPSQRQNAPSSELDGTITISASRGNYKDEAYVQILPTADNNYIVGEDAQALLHKNLNNQMINVFTQIDNLYIKTNRLRDLNDTLRIGIVTSGAGTTTLQISNIPNDRQYYFEDKLRNITLPITDNNFTCTFDEQGNQIGRFIVYSNRSPSNLDETEFNGNVTAFIYKKELNVVSKDGSDIQKIEIFDVTGRLLHQQVDVNAPHWHYPTNTLNDMLIIRTYTRKGSYVHKVINN